uniref:Uncharacterized protein n=1 Tax=Meloidogyne hapla TaxID=6305 RepID=A0A1I8BBT8_MELHA
MLQTDFYKSEGGSGRKRNKIKKRRTEGGSGMLNAEIEKEKINEEVIFDQQLQIPGKPGICQENGLFAKEKAKE